MNKTLFLLFGILFIPSLIYAQLLPKYPREMNVNYSYTKFSDSFNGTLLDKRKWDVTKNYGRGKCIFIDSEGTTYSVNNGLNLNMVYDPGYCFVDGIIHCPDYISAEIVSKDKFKYGIYEGRMRFAAGKGSWPAFWFFGGSGADDPQYNTGYASEIDIAEYNWHKDSWPSGGYTVHTDHVFHWWWPESFHGTREMEIPGGTENNDVDWNTSHTFKLIYTPYDCTFYIDGAFSWRRSKFYSIVNGGPQDIFPEDINASATYSEWEWFPKHEGQIILSQQVSKYVYDSDISAPQTSLFEWVKFKQFFLAPEITCPQIICSSVTATMNVDPAATNISWSLSPGYLFSGATTGSGTTVNITVSPYYQGKGKITYSFNISCDISIPKETYTAEKEIWINGPDASETSFDVYRSDGVRATKVGNAFLMCPNTTYHIYAMNSLSSPIPLSNYTWTVPSAWSQFYTYQNMISVNTNSSPGGPVTAYATNTASGCNNTVQVVTGYMGSNYSCGSYYMALSPNPSTGRTVLTLSADGDKVVDENTSWEVQVYDQQLGLKEKKTKLKGKDAKIDTSGWKDGVYIVNAIVDGQKVSEKMIVKH